MNPHVFLSGVDGASLRESLGSVLTDERPSVVGVAAAFVSVKGLQCLAKILKNSGRPQCRLVAGTDNAITHPEALYMARDLNWNIRLGSADRGIFHPKLVVGGRAVSSAGVIESLCCVYVGSSNLTAGGLYNNVECGLIAHADKCPDSASTAFAQLWNVAREATSAELRNYAARFAESARRRRVSELQDLGVDDSGIVSAAPTDLRRERPPARPAVRAEFSVAAWAGLQSFTGEYRFQVEFPKAAGRVISQFISAQDRRDGRIEVYCPADGATRDMQYKFYTDNGMFRLNIQNDVPGVGWARENRDGIAIIEQGPRGGAPLRLQLLRPGTEALEIIGRSVALGSWGRTSTRIYGWY